MWYPSAARLGSGCLLLSVWQAALAVDAGPTPKDERWRGTGGVALAATSGNSETGSVLFNIDASRASEVDKIGLGGNYNYARARLDGIRTTTANKGLAFGQYDRDFAPQWFAFGRLALDKDALVDLSLRSAVATGVGYRVIDTPQTTFTLQAGVGYTTERYGSTQTIDGEVGSRFDRTTLFLAEESAHKYSETVSFKQRLEASPTIAGGRGVLVRFNANLAVALNSSLNLTVGVIDTYNSEPPEGAVRNDVSLFTGIDFRFGGP
ncbi:MAG TPA: DUF481 domain-containing protein [Burkholderiaceae bacterium]